MAKYTCVLEIEIRECFAILKVKLYFFIIYRRILYKWNYDFFGIQQLKVMLGKCYEKTDAKTNPCKISKVLLSKPFNKHLWFLEQTLNNSDITFSLKTTFQKNAENGNSLLTSYIKCTSQRLIQTLSDIFSFSTRTTIITKLFHAFFTSNH